MYKKIVLPAVILIITAALIVLIFIIAASITNASPPAEKPFPSSVTLYDSESRRILQISYDEFVEGCICGIIPNSGNIYEEQTLAAIAVVINTNALYTLKNGTGSGNSEFEKMGADFAVSDEFPYVSYTDKAVNLADRALIQSAVKAADRSYLAFDGEPVKLELCAISSGKTRELPFMPSKKLPEDALARGYLTERAFTPSEVLSALSGINITDKAPSEWFENPVYDEYGGLSSIEFLSRGVSGNELRSALSLRSSAISVEYRDETFFFQCKGCGSNAGMSLNAANLAAQNGKSFKEILAEFYTPELI